MGKINYIMSFSIIVALADNNAIGRKNELLCHVPGDLKRFRQITSGHRVIMGRNTYLSLPGRPLKDRTNIVISDKPDEFFEGCLMARSVGEAAELCPAGEECFIIGGGMVYRQFLPLADKLYLTRIYKTFEADTFFPEINPDEWEEISRETFLPGERNDFSYAYITYKRK
jgi:dihydrofolate reductase